MQEPLEIRYENVNQTQQIDSLIRQKVEKLERFCDHIIRCQVAVERPHRHETSGNPYRVRLRITVPRDKEIVVRKEPGDHQLRDSLQSVIINAFNAAERQLKEFVERQQGRVKKHPLEPVGLVVRLFKKEGYGFIKTLADEEVYFHKHSVLDDFERLEIGTQVRFEATMGEKGLQATTVQVVDKPGVRAARTEETHLTPPPGWDAQEQDKEIEKAHSRNVMVQGEAVPRVGLGTWRLTGSLCVEAVEDALRAGYRHIDTAQMYENEEEVGKGLRRASVSREEVFLTTKLGLEALAYDDVIRSTHQSLDRLQTDYLDLLLIHWPVENVPLEETLDAMLELQDLEKVRFIGVSNFTPSLLKRALGKTKIFCNQVEYHPFLNQDPLLKLAREHDLLLTAYCPLARGKVLENEILRDIGRKHDKTPIQVTLRWLVQQEKIAVIPKAAQSEHRESNLELFDFELSAEEMRRIFQLTETARRLIDPEWAPQW